MSIGGGNTSYKFNGEISEILLFNQALSDDDWNTVHNYLSAKYLASTKTVLSGSYSLDSTYSVSASPTFPLLSRVGLLVQDRQNSSFC